MDKNWPQVWYGPVDQPQPEPRTLTEEEDFDPDDEELAETPPELIELLGFDPRTDPEYLAINVDDAAKPSWEYFEKDGATYARPPGRIGGVTHILLKNNTWTPYTGNRTDAMLYGDRLETAPEGVAPPTDED